jgi:methionine-rich copper-binding protein CopC
VAAVVIVFNLSKSRTPHSITLANSILSRDSGAENLLPQKVKLPPNISELRASLILPKAFPSGTRFKADIDNGTDKTSVNVIEQNEKLVTVSIPVSQLPGGEYGLQLTAIIADGSEEAIPGTYRFDIE